MWEHLKIVTKTNATAPTYKKSLTLVQYNIFVLIDPNVVVDQMSAETDVEAICRLLAREVTNNVFAW